MMMLCSLTHAFRMLCTDWPARFIPSRTASSNPVVELAEISITFAIAIPGSCLVESEPLIKQVPCHRQATAGAPAALLL
jgi:hypothetical protein